LFINPLGYEVEGYDLNEGMSQMLIYFTVILGTMQVLYQLTPCTLFHSTWYNTSKGNSKYIPRSVWNCRVNDLWYTYWSHAITGAKQRSHNEAKTESKELPLDGALHLTLFDLWSLPFSRI
jgi:hypothetical protein